jgi:hypothetical protein
MMPNKTYELRNLYFLQNPYSVKSAGTSYPLFLKWPKSSYFKGLKYDAGLLQKALKPESDYKGKPVSEQIFGNEVKQQYTGLKHTANLFYERCKLHKDHIQDIDRRHIEVQERKFGVEINNFSDRGKRLSNLENQLLQLEGQRRDEELAFWKDTVELREKLFQNAGDYKAARHRYLVFSDVEVGYGR